MKENNIIDFSTMPRINELMQVIDIKENSFFNFTDSELKCDGLEKGLLIQEQFLQGLDEDSWVSFTSEVKIKDTLKNTLRGWNQLFELLNEVKGYVFLKELGCQNIEFIPREKRKGVRTPDLKAVLDGKQVICEVKTINKSKDRLEAIQNKEVTDVSNVLSDGFFNGLSKTLNKAKEQCLAYDKDLDAQYYIFLVINFDGTFDYVDQYLEQINHFIQSLDLDDFIIVLTLLRGNTYDDALRLETENKTDNHAR